MSVEILAIGNEGFQIKTDDLTILVDAFYHSAPWVGASPCLRGKDIDAADLILVTHAHADHFHEPDVADVARRTGATIIGPSAVVSRFHGKFRGEKLVALDPPLAQDGQPAATKSVQLPKARVTAFRSFHSREHNSYLVETKSFRFYHDGDNEDTRRIDTTPLDKLDALFIGPWQGSGWVDFIDKLKPRHWFMMHLTKEELDQHEKGTFLPDLCDHIPKGLVTLRPSQKFEMENR
jgi:L-ascorbate metabolism protein UlaG (beta-lactamase superfamily)